MLPKIKNPAPLPVELLRSRSQKVKAFISFHRQNPAVYAAFAALAEAAYRTEKRPNALALLQTIRSTGTRVNNNHAPLYARMYEEHKGRGIFRLRRSS